MIARCASLVLVAVALTSVNAFAPISSTTTARPTAEVGSEAVEVDNRRSMQRSHLPADDSPYGRCALDCRYFAHRLLHVSCSVDQVGRRPLFAHGLVHRWFFGASGGAGIARSSFPRMYNSVRYINGLKGVGPTLGGETIGLNPLCGYPEDLSKKDVLKVVNNKLSVEKIVDKYPVEGNFLSSKGYLTFSAFEQANKGCNPLVVRAIFDSLNTSTDVVAPDLAQEKIDLYKTNPEALAGQLLRAKLLGFSSIFTLLFLLGLADVIAFGHAKDGWFPDWPGLSNGVQSFFDPETGVTAIPKYWLSE